MNLLNQIRHNNSSTIRGFGLKVDPNFIKVPARQLDAPGIQYQNSVVRPSRGVWRNENVQFLLPETATAWSILCTNARTKPFELSEFARMVNRNKTFPKYLMRFIILLLNFSYINAVFQLVCNCLNVQSTLKRFQI